jgi:outer membrane protein OmpA-like peptidoglycan-associated protein
MDYTYRKLAEMDPDRIIDELLRDDDNDGVINRLDQEPNTKPDCQVDTKGRALDSDGDGVLDCDDLEPFTHPDCMVDGVDEFGRGKCPCPDGCEGGGVPCDDIELPSVHFDVDKYYIKPEYYAALHIIAEKMRYCPDKRVVVTGYADNRSDAKYNEQLSWNRVNKVIEYMTTKYGIERNRFIFVYKGEIEEGNNTEYQRYLNRRVDFRFAKEGEKGDSNPAPPHPGIDAGKDK